MDNKYITMSDEVSQVSQVSLFDYCLTQLPESEYTNYGVTYVEDWKEGTCCFCGDECNPASQSCGACTRRLP